MDLGICEPGDGRDVNNLVCTHSIRDLRAMRSGAVAGG